MQVKVKFGDNAAEVANKLLAAASGLGESPEVVETTSSGFLVPEEVAEEAGVEYQGEADEGNQPDAEEAEFDASAFKGKELTAALEERGLSTEGTADEKRARLAEFESNKE